MLEVGEYLISSEADFNGFFNSCLPNKKTKRRFSDEQIKSLETMFESQSKLDPRKKLQFAKELGLQPRQVGIWFQNKRARWKSKQLERDYNILRANYDALASRFESMKRENQSLVFQVKKLKEFMEKNGEERECCRREPAARISSTDGNSGVEMKACSLSEQGMGIDSDEGSSTKAEYFGIEEEEEKKKLVKVADGSLTSTENWEGLESDALLDHSATDNTGYNQWWDFWG